MRMSCNGCRVLRKGCSDACTIRPCLQWIKAPDAQANATVFLAKFYGRAGLLNLLAAAPSDALRPAVFRSLLYEACGRIVNPVYGSVGLLWSGQWQACQAAVEAVLRGNPVVQVDAASDAAAAAPPLLDIRHVAKDPEATAAAGLLRVSRAGRTRFKRASRPHKGKKPGKRAEEHEHEHEPELVVVGVSSDDADERDGRAPTPSHGEESAGSHDHHEHEVEGSEDTDVEAGSGSHSHVSQAEPQSLDDVPASSSSQVPVAADEEEEEQIGLELTLGFEPLAVRRQQQPRSSASYCDRSAASSLMGLRLQLPA